MEALDQAGSLYSEALGYMKTLENRLVKKSKFTDEILMGMVVMALEKLYLALLSNHGLIGAHHTPVAMLNEAKAVVEIPESIEATTKKIAKFESICSLDGFGYKIPAEDELLEIIQGLVEFKDFTKDSFPVSVN